jgi:hypothetical protein
VATAEHWTDAPDEHDYPAAEDYLSLLTTQDAAHIGLTIADGYHRICASHHLNEDADIPCRLVDLLPK